ncbi:MAG: DUF1624 domain-containing protein [Phycisphaerae bacterium]|nr:DUF1624 domain-containing protein [Gemmatimonadaceae bacterium]
MTATDARSAPHRHAPPPTVAAAATRLGSVDLYRGLIMVIMLLDHTRERVHFAGMSENPTDPATTTTMLFVTRWITHLCAPGFVFLAGTSAGLLGLRGYTSPQLSRYLLTRGLVLIALEFFVVRPLVFLNVDLRMLAFLEAIWAIGLSMIALSALIFLGQRAVLVVGLIIVFGHNALDTFGVPQWLPGRALPSLFTKLYQVVHHAGFFPVDMQQTGQLPGPIVFVGYPVLPWIGVIALGYCFAHVYTWNAERRIRVLTVVGVSMIALFVALRVLNVYGNPQKWVEGATAVQTAFSFMNLQKYPPSLDFLLATLAPCMLVLALVDRKPLTSTIAQWFMTFGRVPLFFFLIQWPYVHVAGFLTALTLGQPLTGFTANLVDYAFGPTPAPWGGPLWLVYIAWMSGALLLYFPCRWYASLRARRRDIALLRYI